MRLLHCAALTALFLLVGGAAAAAPQPVQSQLKNMQVVVDDGAEAPPNNWDMALALSVIPLPLSGAQRALAPGAMTATPGTLAAGLAIAPRDTRFLRVATMIYDRKRGDNVMGAGFSGTDGSFVMLAYFDRACTLQGRVEDHGVKSDISLAIPAAGMYWLDIGETPEGVYVIRLAPPELELKVSASR